MLALVASLTRLHHLFDQWRCIDFPYISHTSRALVGLARSNLQLIVYLEGNSKLKLECGTERGTKYDYMRRYKVGNNRGDKDNVEFEERSLMTDLYDHTTIPHTSRRAPVNKHSFTQSSVAMIMSDLLCALTNAGGGAVFHIIIS